MRTTSSTRRRRATILLSLLILLAVSSSIAPTLRLQMTAIPAAAAGVAGAQATPPVAGLPTSSTADTVTSQGEFSVYLPLVTHTIPPTSFQLIDQALARGEITAETALIYKVFAAFGDDRLPSPYRGSASEHDPDSITVK